MNNTDINDSVIVWFFLPENRDDPDNSDGYVCRQLLKHYRNEKPLNKKKLKKFFKKTGLTESDLIGLIEYHEEELRIISLVEWFD